MKRRALLPIGLVLLLAGCGRYGDVKPAPGSIYPQTYPEPALAAPAGPTATQAAAAAQANQGKQFSPGGSYIDPSVRVPVIYGSTTVTGLPSGSFTNSIFAGQGGGLENQGQQPTNVP